MLLVQVMFCSGGFSHFLYFFLLGAADVVFGFEAVLHADLHVCSVMEDYF